LFVLSLLGACALPLLATTRGDSDRAGMLQQPARSAVPFYSGAREHDEAFVAEPVSDGGR